MKKSNSLTQERFFEKFPEKRERIKIITWPAQQYEECRVRCLQHGEYTTRRVQLKSPNSGCPACRSEACSKSAKARVAKIGPPIPMLTNAELLDRLATKFPDIRVMTKVRRREDYVDAAWSLQHTCGTRWASSPKKLLGCKVGCPNCAKITQGGFKKTLKKYTAECLDATDGLVTPIEYLGDSKRSKHRCNVCNKEFNKVPNSLLQGYSRYCPHCKRNASAYSPVSESWLMKLNPKCKRATTEGEHTVRVGNSVFRVDGYDAKKKTIYEFLGDCWHGNPAVYRPRDRPHPYNDKTAAALHKATMTRMAKIAQHSGCKIIYVWEADFRTGKMRSGIIYP